MSKSNTGKNEFTKTLTGIEGGVLPEAERVRYWAGKTIRHSTELNRSPKSKI